MTRGDRVIRWIEQYCVEPSSGKPVGLTDADRVIIRRIYDAPGGPYGDIPVTRPLAAYLALLHICGPEALQTKFKGPNINLDCWSVWRATSLELQAVLRRDGERIICPELDTRYPAAA
jgi:hypothetical protein